MPANIIKPYTAPDSPCPSQDINTNSVYKYPDTTTNEVDGDENTIADNGRTKVTRHSPTYSLELSSSSSRPGSWSALLIVVVFVAVNPRYL